MISTAYHKYRILVILFLVLLLVSCNLPFFSEKTGNTYENDANLEDFPELAVFGELASVHGKTVRTEVDANSKEIKLDEDVSLLVPKGAFPESNQLEVTRIDVAFDKIAIDASAGKFFAINTSQDVPLLGAPVVLQVPGFSSEVNVVRYEDGQWVKIPVDQGETVQVSIDHFSKGIFGFFEWWSERDIELGETLDSMDNNSPQSRMRTHIEQGDENVQGFFGVNEQSEKTGEELCAEIIAVLGEYNQKSNRQFPDVGGFSSSIKLADFLFAGSSPSETGGPFWQATKDSMVEIESRLLGEAEQVSPAELLRIALEANNGNIPLAVLAAHNYLKELTYKGRNSYSPKDGIDPEYGVPASRLQSWRESDNITASGEYDKMGPLYHIFAAMSGALWLPTSASGPGIAAGEAFLRTFRVGGDRPDTEKAAADLCGIDAAAWLRDNSPTGDKPVKPPTDIEGDPDLGTIPDTNVEDQDFIIISDLHGAYCDEPEGTFAYTWQVNILQDVESSIYIGTIKWHNCPGGGRVAYHVVGEPQPGEKIIMLTGTKMDGGGKLFDESLDYGTFYLDLENGQLTDPPEE